MISKWYRRWTTLEIDQVSLNCITLALVTLPLTSFLPWILILTFTLPLILPFFLCHLSTTRVPPECRLGVIEILDYDPFYFSFYPSFYLLFTSYLPLIYLLFTSYFTPHLTFYFEHQKEWWINKQQIGFDFRWKYRIRRL